MKRIAWIACLLLLCSTELLAQPVVLYVSKQSGEASEHAGEASKVTDRYEEGVVTLSHTGPLSYTVDPGDLSIDPEQTKTWTGVITVDVDEAPSPGSMTTAVLRADYDVIYSQPAGWGNGGTVIDTYRCEDPDDSTGTGGGCHAHPDGPGDHEMIQNIGYETKDFEVYSIWCGVPDSIPCVDGKAQLNASVYPEGGTVKWTTPWGDVLYGKSAELEIVEANGNFDVKATYIIGGVSYEDKGRIRLGNLTDFDLPYCVDTTMDVKDIAEVDFDGACETEVIYLPAQVTPPSLLQMETKTVTAQANGESLTADIILVNSNNEFEPFNVTLNLGALVDQIKTIMEAIANGGVSPCNPSGSGIPAGSFSYSRFKQCCPNSGTVQDGEKYAGSVTWGYGATCHFPIFGCPFVASLDAVVSAGFSLKFSVDKKSTCVPTPICANAEASSSIGGGLGVTIGAGVVSADLQLIIEGTKLSGTLCFTPPPKTAKGKLSVGAGKVQGTVEVGWGLLSYSVSYPLWSELTSGEISFF